MPDEARMLPVLQPGRQPSAPPVPPVFEKVGLVGLGLIGGSIALAARQVWPTGLVIGVDRKSVLEKAMILHAIDVAADDPAMLSGADLVILAAPVRQNIAVLETLASHVQGSAVVTDVSSTKREIVAAARRLPARLTFVGGHPLGGAPRAGIEAARPDLFTGRPWLFTPVGDAAGPALDRLFSFVKALGARPQVMRVDEHDRLLALVSHLPQLTASALMHVVGTTAAEPGLALTGRGLYDATRLASSPADIWRDICATNADQVGTALDELIAELQTLRRSLKSGEVIDRLFASAASWRERLSELYKAEGRRETTEGRR